MQKYIRLVLMIVSLLFAAILLSFPVKAERGLNVAVIAHSLSTRAEARAVLRKQGWFATENLRQADGILVVCRSSLRNPLSNNYRSIKELDEDADSQLNISGANFHIYVFRINDNLSVDEVNHVRYEAGEVQ
ncbi:hypothetical protein [Methylotenera versatilis]|uniref:hypothetical protein n=1 Tax=Methylotenera versatilis TaxID=1055487 RepID=UPI0006457575|nr:hypothetical protein [Methylotenera versatilis]